MKQKGEEPYNHFEQGPIRPPSEAASLLIRVTRNCPWNRCAFCPVYKGKRFSLRPADHVIQDIDAIHAHLETIHRGAGSPGPLMAGDIRRIADDIDPEDRPAFNAAFHWFMGGMKSVFLQDANSLIIKPEDLIRIVKHIRLRFPWVERITSYARSHTIARISGDNLKSMREAGLNRIHVGMESGSDEVLKRVKKGSTQADHIKAGIKVKEAGMELSEYVMPGLGGKALSNAHADETADALNRIDPDFIRLRTLAIPETVELHREQAEGRFKKMTDFEVTQEILRFIRNLNGVTGYLKSDHILNLFENVEGRLPDAKPAMEAILTRFLDMSPEDRTLYQVGRRIGVFSDPDDMNSVPRLEKARETCRSFGITPENADQVIDELMKRFI